MGGMGVIKFIKIIFLWLFLSPSIFAATYYIAATGGDDGNDGLSSGAPIATFTHAYTHLTAGDTLILLDGTYSSSLAPTISGTEGNPITFQAQNRGQAIIKPSSNANAILVYSTAAAVRGYLTFDGLIARSTGEYSAIRVASDDNVNESQMVNNIIIKNTGAYGSAQETNTVVFDIGNNARDCLFEDVWAYGRGRKAMQVFGSLRITVRRAVLRYDYWEGDSYKPNDPRGVFSGYNTQYSVFENIIALDSAPTPPGYTADRSNFTSSGNDNTALVSGSSHNTYRGLLGLNGYGNNLEINGGSGNPNHSNTFKDLIGWGSQYYGINFQGNDDGSIVTYSTMGRNGLTGFRMDPYPSQPITDAVIENNLSYDNGGYGYYYNVNEISSFANNSGISNSDADLEASYAPTIDYIVQPTMVSGHERGATMYYRYVDGTLTETKLWPWPNEDLIKDNMCNATDLAESHRVSSNGTNWEPGWCASEDTLTKYIWEYLGNEIPADIYTDETAPTASSASILADGTRVRLVASENVQFGAGGTGGGALTGCSGGATTLGTPSANGSYVEWPITNRTVYKGETSCVLAYTQPTDGLQDTAATPNDMATFADLAVTTTNAPATPSGTSTASANNLNGSSAFSNTNGSTTTN